MNHHVRSKLDELKRTELTRLKDLAKQTYGGGGERSANPFGHLDHENPNTFEIEDLKKLIHKVSYPPYVVPGVCRTNECNSHFFFLGCARFRGS